MQTVVICKLPTNIYFNYTIFFKHVNMAWFKSSYVHVNTCAQQIIKDTSTRSVTCDWANESQEENDAKDKRATISWCLCCQT